MIDWLRGLSDWLLEFADSDWAILILVLASFSESIFFPIPPDPLLVGIAIQNPEAAIWLAILVSISSVSGATIGYWIGGKLGRPILYRIVSPKKIDAVERIFSKYGTWAILLAAFTPIPYKVFTITAGMLALNLRPFIIASLIGRSARFLILGILVFIFGNSIKEFIDRNFELLTLGCGATLILAIGIYLLIKRAQTSEPIEKEAYTANQGTSSPNGE